MNKVDQKDEFRNIVIQNQEDLTKICRNLAAFMGENGEKADVALKYATGFFDGLKVRYSVPDTKVPCIHAVIGKDEQKGTFVGNTLTCENKDTCSGAGMLLFVIKMITIYSMEPDGVLDFYIYFGDMPRDLPQADPDRTENVAVCLAQAEPVDQICSLLETMIR